MSAARARASNRVVGPQTAAASSTRRSGVVSPSSWLRTASSSDHGRRAASRSLGLPSRHPVAATISSIRNGLPPERVETASMTAEDGGDE